MVSSSRREPDVSVCRNPIFLIGAERSGTTILAVSLGRHSQLWFSGESHVFPNVFERERLERAYEHGTYRWRLLREQGVTRQEFLESLGLGVNALFTSRSGGRRWIEKTPQNTLMADILADMFPESSFVHILRDGREVVHSMIHFLDEPDRETRADRVKGGTGPLWARDFRVACRTWARAAEAALDFSDSHEHRCLTVHHRDLVADPAASFRTIWDFLQVTSEDEPITFFRSTRLNSSFRDRGAMPRGDVWGEWSAEQRRTFLEVAGRAMTRCGFD
jgi:hypothetical protein